MYSPLPLLKRGLIAGALAGGVTGAFSLLLVEPLMDRAIRLEEASAPEHGHGGFGAAVEHHTDLFNRGTQHLGLFVTAVVTGMAIGVFFAITHALMHRQDPDARLWPRAMTLAVAGFTGVALLPFLRYPANPPGVGDSGTVAGRTVYWLAALTIGVLGMLLARQVYLRLAGREAQVRHTAVALVTVAILALLFALPGNSDPVEVPATLLWDFRLLSLASQALLWVLLGAVFGALGIRATRQSEERRSPLSLGAPRDPVTAG